MHASSAGPGRLAASRSRSAPNGPCNAAFSLCSSAAASSNNPRFAAVVDSSSCAKKWSALLIDFLRVAWVATRADQLDSSSALSGCAKLASMISTAGLTAGQHASAAATSASSSLSLGGKRQPITDDSFSMRVSTASCTTDSWVCTSGDSCVSGSVFTRSANLATDRLSITARTRAFHAASLSASTFSSPAMCSSTASTVAPISLRSHTRSTRATTSSRFLLGGRALNPLSTSSNSDSALCRAFTLDATSVGTGIPTAAACSRSPLSCKNCSTSSTVRRRDSTRFTRERHATSASRWASSRRSRSQSSR
mmetsp:Transcript_19969/g.63517  ORF Transcript_19969/g.63517 Transcript_19969/m.63517 type:complete len:309 (+) Transcript_19969:1138-2064(+)